MSVSSRTVAALLACLLLMASGAHGIDPNDLEVRERLDVGTTSRSSASVQVNAPGDAVRRFLTRTLRREPEKTAAVGAPLADRVGRDVQIVIRPGVGTPMEIRGEDLAGSGRSPLFLKASDADIHRAEMFLESNRALFGLTHPADELRLEKILGEEKRTLRFTQFWAGIPVWPSYLNVHFDAKGTIHLVNGATFRSPRKLSPRPSVTINEALKIARSIHQESVATGDPDLIVYSSVRRPRLAWRVRVQGDPLLYEDVIVDALTGKILNRFTLVMSNIVSGSGIDLFGVRRPLMLWQDGAVFHLINSGKQMYKPQYGSPLISYSRGSIVIGDGLRGPTINGIPVLMFRVTSSSPTTWGPPDAVSVAYHLSEAYDYFLERHGRDSIDSQGESIVAIVRVGLNKFNAYWIDGTRTLYFGDGDRFAGSLDVVSHELVHGISSSDAGLLYQGQSGALSEALSDIFGEMVELRTTGSTDWLSGSGLSAPGRSLANPSAYNQPDRMSRFVHTNEDDGGVHINSGIINRAFYLLAQGLPGAIGARDAERIFYRAMRHHLGKNSTFLDARLASEAAAADLFGSNSMQARKTAEAFDEVEIYRATSPPPPSTPPVSAPDSLVFNFVENGQRFLGRRESAAGDAEQGVYLSDGEIAEFSRSSVSGDGSVAVFVNKEHDLCFVATSGTVEEECLGFPGEVWSAAMSPDLSRFAFVFMNENQPDNRIVIFDIPTEQSREIQLSVAVPDSSERIVPDVADAMTFTSDSRFLLYDALVRSTSVDGAEVGLWSIFAYDYLDEFGFALFTPSVDYDVAYPAVSRTSDRYMAFDVVATSGDSSGVFVLDLAQGDLGMITQGNGYFSVPSFTGDDGSISYSVEDQTETRASLHLQRLSANRLAPQGTPGFRLAGADFGVTYRRGAWSGPTTRTGNVQFATSSLTVKEGASAVVPVNRVDGAGGNGSVRYRTLSGSAQEGSDFVPTEGVLTWPDGGTTPQYVTVTLLNDSMNEPTESFSIQLFGQNGLGLGQPSTMTVSVENKVVNTIPAAPSDLKATVSGQSVDLTWRDNSDNETEFVGYFSFDGATFEAFATLPANATTMGVIDMTPGYPYYFRITARNASGESQPTNVVVVTLEAGRKRLVGRR